MLLFVLVLFLLAGDGFTQMQPMAPRCSSSSPTPSCTLTYKPIMPPQIGPTSTVYRAIITTYYNIVDCRYCTVTNSADNPAAKGPFTTRITSSTLTVSAVGCLPETTAMTRRDLPSASTDVLPKIKATSGGLVKARYRVSPRQSFNQTTLNATQLSSQGLSLFTSLNSAIFAIDLINTPGVSLVSLCRELRVAQQLPSSNLNSVNIDTQQVGDIVCYASVYGFYFNITTTQLIGELTAAILGVELGADYTGSTNTSQLCGEIDYSVEPYLGVNATAVSAFICQPTTASLTSASVGTGIWSLTAPTGGAGPYANFTGVNTATGGSYDSLNITFSTAGNGGYGGSRIPPSPASQQYFPAWTTSTTASLEHHAY